jgi:hypothetical protein
MKKIHLLTGIVGLFTVLDTSAVTAGNAPGAVTITGGAAYYHFSPRRHAQSGVLPNLALAYDFDQRWAVEAGWGVINSDTNSDNSLRAQLYTIDGIYRLTPHNRFEPYIIAGIGALNLKPPVGSDAQYQGNVNAGIGTQFFADKVIALRGEVRDLYSVAGGKNDWMVNFGISYLIGGA